MLPAIVAYWHLRVKSSVITLYLQAYLHMLNTIKLGIFSGNFQVVSCKHFILLYRMHAQT